MLPKVMIPPQTINFSPSKSDDFSRYSQTITPHPNSQNSNNNNLGIFVPPPLL